MASDAASSAPPQPLQPLFLRRYSPYLIALLLAASVMLVYGGSYRNGFIDQWDDPSYALNPHVVQGLTWGNIAWAFTTTDESNWHPLTWISHMADYQLFQGRPAGHHVINVLLHALNVVLFFFLLRLGTGHTARSGLAAFLFALHPVNVESVAWVSERKGLLCTLFLLLAVLAYGWYARKPGAGRYLAVVGLFALALMAKPMAITLPALLLLLDYWPLGRVPGGALRAWRRLVVEKIPLFVMSLGSAVITIYAQGHGGSIAASDSLSLSTRIQNAAYSYVIYIFHGIWPLRLAAFYPHPGTALAGWKVAIAVIVLLAVTAVVWRYREHRYLLTGWLWYLGSMVPVIGILQVGRQAMADRYAYLPFLGLFVIAVWLAADLALRVNLSALAGWAIAVAVLSGCAALSYVQTGYWRNGITLFARAAEVTEDNYVAEANLGAALEQAGQDDLAFQHYVAAVRIAPGTFKTHYLLAHLLQRHNRAPEALREYQQTLVLGPSPEMAATVHNNVGALLMQLNRPDDALAQFSIAIGLNPNQQNSYIGRGTIEYQQGKLDAAIADFSRAAQIAPSARALYWLGRTLEDKGDLKPAAQAYGDALKLAPAMGDAAERLHALVLKLDQSPH